jgi:hypothetical protein
MGGKALGTMDMDMIFTPREFFNALRIGLCWGMISFILLLPYFSLVSIIKRILKKSNADDEKIKEGM